jgi:hypothetical protein
VCARGDGIRGSKDLRAEIGKFPNSTNERKQMSTKTIKRRIALVAASALTAGFLSVVAMPAANAADGDLTVTTAAGTVTLPTLTGGSTTGTGTITVGGSVTVGLAAGSVAWEVRVSGGTFTSVTTATTISASKTVAYAQTAGASISGLIATPTAAGRNMVISTYTGANAAAAASSTTAVKTLTITVVASGVSGVANAGASYLQIVNTTSTLTATSNADATYANIVAAGGAGIISYSIKDALTTNLPSTTVIQGTVKSGACVVATSSSFSPAGTSIVTAAQAGQIYVAQADSTNTPATTCTVDVTADGALIGTKTILFQGPVAKLVVTGLARGKTSTANTSMGYITAQDSAGNAIGNVALTGELVSPASADSSIVTAVLAIAGTAVGSSTVNGGTSPASTPSTIGWTCGSTSSNSVKIKYKASNGVGGYIYSDDIVATCAGNPANYTASLDKASYVPGDIATLTITAKDSKGNLTNDAATLSAGSTISITGSNLTAVATPLSLDTFSGGSKTVKFTVGATGGAYNLIVDLPHWNTTTYSQTAVSVPYKITTSGVTNEDVLKSIVALIASINKQIQALQKLILKR